MTEKKVYLTFRDNHSYCALDAYIHVTFSINLIMRSTLVLTRGEHTKLKLTLIRQHSSVQHTIHGTIFVSRLNKVLNTAVYD